MGLPVGEFVTYSMNLSSRHWMCMEPDTLVDTCVTFFVYTTKARVEKGCPVVLLSDGMFCGLALAQSHMTYNSDGVSAFLAYVVAMTHPTTWGQTVRHVLPEDELYGLTDHTRPAMETSVADVFNVVYTDRETTSADQGIRIFVARSRFHHRFWNVMGTDFAPQWLLAADAEGSLHVRSFLLHRALLICATGGRVSPGLFCAVKDLA